MKRQAAIVEAPTERRNPRTLGIDKLPTLAVLRLINAEDQTVAPAVECVLPGLAAAVDQTVDRIRRGGQVHYFAAGTPARLAALDAAEMAPTFSAPPELFTVHTAGGEQAFASAVESAEDDHGAGARDAEPVRPVDVVLGVSASGRTPYVAGALATARNRHALTVLITSNPAAALAKLADVLLAPDTGPEVIAGSTRMKAGTAQKLILNAYSTTVMIRLGHTWSNLMISLNATNEKLRGRAVRILAEASGAPEPRCRSMLAEAGGDLKTALVALLLNVNPHEAATLLQQAAGSVHNALGQPRPTAISDETH